MNNFFLLQYLKDFDLQTIKSFQSTSKYLNILQNATPKQALHKDILNRDDFIYSS